jgi:hypothetical protein
MSCIVDFAQVKFSDGAFVVVLKDPTPVGDWEVEFTLSKRFGDPSPFIRKSSASGYNGVSGVTVTSSGNGQWSIPLYNSEVSGKDPGNYAYVFGRTTSGVRTELSKGFRIMDW